jgi:hypothetical protein
MLKILHGVSLTALDAFHAADNPVDQEFVADLQRIADRTWRELEALAGRAEESS